MLSKIISNKNPMRIFEKCIHGGLGKGNIGVFMARAGVGKTACLIQLSLYSLFKGDNVLHISVGQKIDDVRNWYDEILENLVPCQHLSQLEPIREEIESKRIILSYTDGIFDPDRLQNALVRFNQHGNFKPDVIFIDGYSFETITKEIIERFKEIAISNNIEMWFAVKTHREGLISNERGIPSPCNTIDDMLSVIVFLSPLENSVRLRLLKDHNNPDLKDFHLLLDLRTLLIKDDYANE